MDFVADFHLHSKYSRAVSKDMILPLMAKTAKEKGVDILTVSDWTHTLWLKEIRAQIIETTDGLYRLKSQFSNPNDQDANAQKEPLFIFSTEISSIYSEKGKLKRIHNLVFVPNLETAEKVNKELLRRGANLSADGRPIIGISSKNLLSLILEIDERCFLIPCHVWTPHFGIYGSKSGYDSLEEAFEDLTSYVYGVETGLSSDPEMNWRIEELNDRSILSFSDAHSLPNIGREATVFSIQNSTLRFRSGQEFKISYEDIRSAIKRDKNASLRVGYTIEFYPEEGKYHYSGHRSCGVVLTPEEILKNGAKCPVCKAELTEGVAVRIEQLGGKDFYKGYQQKTSPSAVMWHTDTLRYHPPYVKLVRLIQIIAASLDSTVTSMKVKVLFDQIQSELGSELTILLKTPISDIEKIAGTKISDGVRRVRAGQIHIDPGFDGVYGKVKIWEETERQRDRGIEEIEGRKEQLGLEF